MRGLGIGARVARVEDVPLVRGEGRYVDDLDGERLWVAFVRSTEAHARLVSVDLGPARALLGVVDAVVAADLGLGRLRAHARLPAELDRLPLAAEVVRYVGDPVAAVVAADRATAADAAAAVEVVYAPLPPVADAEGALAPDAPALLGHGAGNLVLDLPVGERDEVLAGAARVVAARLRNQRVAPAPMEPDGVLARVDEATGELSVWASTQRVHEVRAALATVLGEDPARIRVRAPQVGGGFGGKYDPSPETMVVAALARRLGRPVAWTQTRVENLQGMPHGRAQLQEVALGVGEDGTFESLWVELVGDAGAYPILGSLIPGATLAMASGTYRFARVGGRGRSAATTTTPVGAYRGAGRPEACALVERVVDIAAAELGVDPLELRRRNLIRPEELPYRTATGMTYDSGNYQACLDAVAARLGIDDLRAEQARRRAAGDRRLLGVGVAMWIDCTPMNRPGEWARIAVVPHGEDPDGVRVEVRDGANDQGQAHATSWGLVLAERLGLGPDVVVLHLGDTAHVPHGEGTGSARSAQLVGASLVVAADQVLEAARPIAAHLLEAAPADVVTVDGGRLGVVGSPGRSVSWGQVARAAADPGALPPAAAASLGPEGLVGTGDVDQPGPTFPAGAHGAVVEVDVETGAVTLVRFAAVDDCGRAINPVVVEGQQHGGIAQGIAQALYEEVVYDEAGNPLTSSLADYLVPSAADLPPIEADRIETPSPVNPLGAKGIGQAGAIGATPAVQNAVVDALGHLGIRHIDLPLGPERVWRAIQEALPAEEHGS